MDFLSSTPKINTSSGLPASIEINQALTNKRFQRLTGNTWMEGKNHPSFLNSRIFPGWHFSTLQMEFSVDSLIAFALPVFKTERFDALIPTSSESLFNFILRFASITSRLIIIAIASFKYSTNIINTYCKTIYIYCYLIFILPYTLNILPNLKPATVGIANYQNSFL